MVTTGASGSSLEDMTTDALKRIRRDLTTSLALSPEGSAVRLSIATETGLVDAELARRAANCEASPMPPPAEG